MRTLRSFFHLTASALALVLMLDANGQPMQPGLWKSSTDFHTTSGEMERAMARSFESLKKLPKSERKALEAKMRGIYAAGNTIALKFCVSRDAAKYTEPLPVEGGKDEEGCTTANVVRTGNTIQASFFCAEDDVHGERVIKLSESGSFLVGNIKTVHVPIVFDGKPETVTTVSDTQFVSKACGATPELGK
jgi:hypothetical protein